MGKGGGKGPALHMIHAYGTSWLAGEGKIYLQLPASYMLSRALAWPKNITKGESKKTWAWRIFKKLKIERPSVNESHQLLSCSPPAGLSGFSADSKWLVWQEQWHYFWEQSRQEEMDSTGYVCVLVNGGETKGPCGRLHWLRLTIKQPGN